MNDRECEVVRACIYLICERAFPGVVFSVACERRQLHHPINVIVRWTDGPNKNSVDQILLHLAGARFYEPVKNVIECKVKCTRKMSVNLSKRIHGFVERLCESKAKRFDKRMLTFYRRKWSSLGYPLVDRFCAFKGIVRS